MNTLTRKQLTAIFKDAGIDHIEFHLARNGTISTLRDLMTPAMYKSLARRGLIIKQMGNFRHWRDKEYSLLPAPQPTGWSTMWRAFARLHMYEIPAEAIIARAIFVEGAVEWDEDARCIWSEDNGGWLIFADPTRLYNNPIGPEAEPAVTIAQASSRGMLRYQGRALEYDLDYRVLAIEPTNKGFTLLLDDGQQYRLSCNLPGDTPLTKVEYIDPIPYKTSWYISSDLWIHVEVYPFAERSIGIRVNHDLRTHQTDYGWYGTIADSDHVDCFMDCMQIVRNIGDKLALGVIKG